MSFRLSDAEVFALAIFAITSWLMWVRNNLAQESNWPLFYYLGMVLYQKTSGSFIYPNFLYAGVVCAMLIRFEFLGPKLIKVFRFLEFVCLTYVAWRCLDFVYFR